MEGNMDVTHITDEQLERLTLPSPEWRLDLLLDGTSPAAHAGGSFEPVDACRGEDKRRANALRALPEEFSNSTNLDCGCSARVLDQWALTGAGPKSTASATYMRDRRLAILGRVLKLAHDNSSSGLALVSLSHPEWCLRPDRKWWPDVIPLRLKNELSGISRTQGFLIAYQHCWYDEKSEQYAFGYKGICTGEKLQRLFQKRDGSKPVPAVKITIQSISDLSRQLLGIMPNFIAANVPGTTSTSTGVWREPYHGMYLAQLDDEPCLSSLFYFDGVCLKNGELVMVDS
jgi:hypothetical protein